MVVGKMIWIDGGVQQYRCGYTKIWQSNAADRCALCFVLPDRSLRDEIELREIGRMWVISWNNEDTYLMAGRYI